MLFRAVTNSKQQILLLSRDGHLAAEQTSLPAFYETRMIAVEHKIA
jgi:hypothetical protein